MTFGGADLHCHSSWSDGRDTPEELAAKAAAAGLSVLALSDHDTLQGIPDFEAACARMGLVAVPAVELSSLHGDEDTHVLGLFVDPGHEAFRERLSGFRAERSRRGEGMAARLEALGCPVDLESILRVVGPGSFGRPHLARALVQARHVADEDEAFARFLAFGGPAYLPKPKWEMAAAISAIRAAGGLAVLAHPVWHDDPERVVREGREAGLDGLEVSHSDHSDQDEVRFRALAGRLGLLMTAGSDHHGAADGRRPLGCRRLPEAEWAALAEAGEARRREAGRPLLGFGPA
jgi:predicted metal-dependent phosphoesterase TrpH